MLTLEKFEQASEIVKKVTNPYKAGLQRIFKQPDRRKSLPEAGEYAVYRSIQGARRIL